MLEPPAPRSSKPMLPLNCRQEILSKWALRVPHERQRFGGPKTGQGGGPVARHPGETSQHAVCRCRLPDVLCFPVLAAEPQ